jgi:hypothetical protein
MKGQKTGGRRSGSLNKKTLARLALVQAAASTTPVEFLLAIMRSDSPLLDLKTRIECARIVAPYIHTRAGEAVPKPDPKLVEGEQTYGPGDDPLLLSRAVPTRRD